MGDSTPNPGSPKAAAIGCRCAVLDNNHGRYAPYPPDGWWVNAECPVHGMIGLANKEARREQ